MAEGRRFVLNPQLDIAQILLEAKSRWLRPSEVCEILRNYQKFHLTPDPPYKPPGGSLFLFDRKALRYFRKDGHCWRKKKDGKTVREAHEKLKSGSVDVLHCYYAHGEDNENFQRRSYWMLDGQLEHIVLVHYREVNEGSRSAIPRLLNSDSGTQSHFIGAQSAVAAQTSYASSPSTVDWNGQTPSSELEDVDSGEDFGASSLSESISGSGFHITSFPVNNITDRNLSGCSTSMLHPHTRGFIDGAGSSRSFSSPFYLNHVVSENTIPSEGQQTNCQAPQEAAFPRSSGEHSDTGLFAGGSFSHGTTLPTWPGLVSFNQKFTGMHDQKIDQPNCTNIVTKKVVNSFPDGPDAVKFGLDGRYQVIPDKKLQPFAREDGDRLSQENQKVENVEQIACLPDKCSIGDDVHVYQVPNKHLFHTTPPCSNVTPSIQPLKFENEDSYALKNASESSLHNNENEGLKKLDSFGRWMSKEIGRDCDDSLMATDSGNYWNTLGTHNDDKEVSSLSRHMQLDVESLGPSVSQEQLFSILDFSPDWAYSGIETKVLISGNFLGGIEPCSIKWCCMFGEIEVSAEVLTTNVLRCQAPAHISGRVPFYITCSNRLACSEIREFEYRENLTGAAFSSSLKSEPRDEVHLQIRLAKMLSLGSERKKVACSVEKRHKCNLENEFYLMLNDDDIEWENIEKDSKACEGYAGNPRDALVQKLLKSRLCEWLANKIHEDGKGPNVLDEEGQGVIHLAAALGYEWAMTPIAASGVSPNFRDAHGRTGLHWAAYFGREETVTTLIRLGAAPGAVEDPTSKFPQGRTAADLASSRGHKGIAGYLAEADLTSHLSSLGLTESVMESVSATLAGEKAIETVENHNIIPLDGDRGEQLSLRGSLAAVRNSAQAAARIQAAFRVHSFRQRQLMKSTDENSEITSESIVVSSKPQRASCFNDSLNMAAVKIQQKYRGYKGHQEFKKFRYRIVKLQAHVRGHQVRKQYKKVVWSVGIVEKAILRWRRKGAGLRGFRAEKGIGDVQQEVEKTDEYDFLRLGRRQKVAGLEKALARVQSMVRHPEARDQYMRLVASSKSKLGDEGSTANKDGSSDGENKAGEDPLASMMA